MRRIKKYKFLAKASVMFWLFVLAAGGAVVLGNRREAMAEEGEVFWQVYFTEQGSHGRQLFPPHRGTVSRGEGVNVDFPQIFLGKDRYLYRAVRDSPWQIEPVGSGMQTYYVEYVKGEQLEEEDLWKEERERLEDWIHKAGVWEQKITGREPSRQFLVTESQEDSERRLKNLISMTEDRTRHEIYLICKNHQPSPVSIVGDFPDLKDFSWVTADVFSLEQENYTVILAGYSRDFTPQTCTHRWEEKEKISVGCRVQGKLVLMCGRCLKEEQVILPATGHRDEDEDLYCDQCDEPKETWKEPEGVFYQIGDVQARRMGDQYYLFRCIDEDYADSLGNVRGTALFLCDSVIPSDVDSTSEKMKLLTFGENNNYKNSYVRHWLQKQGEGELTGEQKVYTGMCSEFEGITKEGSFHQFQGEALRGHPLSFQLMEDSLFLLSVEEAVKYKEWLWRFQGAEENNPETQISSYSRGYYLRTVQYGGKGVYVVDLEQGNLYPAAVDNSAMGLRPAMALRQG